MSLSDEIEIRVAGNLCQPVTLVRRGGLTLATTTIAASPIALIGGPLESPPLHLALEVHGLANAAAFAAHAGLGSRIILRGTLVLRPVNRIEEWPPTSGGAAIAVRLTRQEPVIVVERLLHVSPPASHVVED